LVSGFDLLSLLFDCRVLHTMVQCEAVRSAILATAWLLVMILLRTNLPNFVQFPIHQDVLA